MSAGEIKDDDMMSEPGLLSSLSREELETKLTETETELDKKKDEVLRLHAEIQNLHRRKDNEVADAYKYSVKKILEELIPVLDSLELGLAVEGTEHDRVKSMRDGMELTLQMLKKVLEKFGVKEIHPLNEMFNPAFHEVMLAQPNSEVAPNTIIQVMQKGYLLHDRVIRPARVMIAKAA